MNTTEAHADAAIEAASVTNGPSGSVIVSCPAPGCDWTHAEPMGAPWELLAVLLGGRIAERVVNRRAVRAVEALAGHLEAAAAAGTEGIKADD